MVVPSESWSVIAAAQVDADSPLDETLMEAIRGNLIHIEEWLGDGYAAAKDHDHDEVNSKSVVLAANTVGSSQIIANSVTTSELKFASGSWGVGIANGAYGAVNMVEYSHWPQTRGDNAGFINFGQTGGVALTTGNQFQMWSYNGSGGFSTWRGNYEYHSVSEQIIEVFKDSVGDVIGVHVTEKGNENSMTFLDSEKNEILTTREVLTIDTNPGLFKSTKEKKVIHNADYFLLSENKHLLKMGIKA